MRKLLILCAAVLAACGSSETPKGPAYQVMGSAAGFYATTGTCALGTPPTETIGASVAIVEVTDYALTCNATTFTTVPANDAAAALIIVRAAFLPYGGPVATAPGLVAENYPFFDLATLAQGKIPPLDAGLNAAFFTGALLKCGASPGAGSSSAITGGTVTVTSVTGTRITGSVNAALAGGGTLTGSFTADACQAYAPTLDVCASIQTLSLNLTPPTCG